MVRRSVIRRLQGYVELAPAASARPRQNLSRWSWSETEAYCRAAQEALAALGEPVSSAPVFMLPFYEPVIQRRSGGATRG
jgi:hypothetical protein